MEPANNVSPAMSLCSAGKYRQMLPSVCPGVSSTLALSEPARYCVIDFRGWRALYAAEKRTFTIRDYQAYRSEVDQLARSLGWSVQETDLALWAYDEQENRRASKALERTGATR